MTDERGRRLDGGRGRRVADRRGGRLTERRGRRLTGRRCGRLAERCGGCVEGGALGFGAACGRVLWRGRLVAGVTRRCCRRELGRDVEWAVELAHLWWFEWRPGGLAGLQSGVGRPAGACGRRIMGRELVALLVQGRRHVALLLWTRSPAALLAEATGRAGLLTAAASRAGLLTDPGRLGMLLAGCRGMLLTGRRGMLLAEAGRRAGFAEGGGLSTLWPVASARGALQTITRAARPPEAFCWGTVLAGALRQAACWACGPGVVSGVGRVLGWRRPVRLGWAGELVVDAGLPALTGLRGRAGTGGLVRLGRSAGPSGLAGGRGAVRWARSPALHRARVLDYARLPGNARLLNHARQRHPARLPVCARLPGGAKVPAHARLLGRIRRGGKTGLPTHARLTGRIRMRRKTRLPTHTRLTGRIRMRRKTRLPAHARL